MKELSIGAGTNFVDGRRVKIDKDASWNMLAIASLGEKGLICSSIDSSVGIRAAVWKKTVFQEVTETVSESVICMECRTTNSSQAELPSCTPACPMCRCKT